MLCYAVLSGCVVLCRVALLLAYRKMKIVFSHHVKLLVIIYVKLIQSLDASHMVRVWSDEPGDDGVA